MVRLVELRGVADKCNAKHPFPCELRHELGPTDRLDRGCIFRLLGVDPAARTIGEVKTKAARWED